MMDPMDHALIHAKLNLGKVMALAMMLTTIVDVNGMEETVAVMMSL